VFDSVCDNVVRSFAEKYNLWYVLDALRTIYTAHCNCCWFVM